MKKLIASASGLLLAASGFAVADAVLTEHPEIEKASKVEVAKTATQAGMKESKRKKRVVRKVVRQVSK